ncbi:hypothetical protein [Armatimonas sp.]|uniref:hypothetical protein n=1 Tax=Armatimonas sp. TaxID=1872638 RepID=UPI00286D5E36|nr:hypothetical protein [Armatimonas sp.]
MQQQELGGWKAAHECHLGVRKGNLVVRTTGGDPYLTASDVPRVSGTLTLEWRQRTVTRGSAEVFWSDARGGFAAECSVPVSYTPGEKWQELKATLPVQGALTGLRLDPCQAQGELELSWLRLRDASGKLVREWKFNALKDSEPAGELPKPEKWAYLDNGKIRVGVKVSSGAAIGWLSLSKSERNLLNHWDHGRLVQQSYYGDDDGSIWGKQPWRWNPVQGGDYKGGAAKVLELKQTKTTLYAKSIGRNWAGCTDLPEAIFEQWITLKGDVAQVKYRLSYSGTHSHASRHHEIPAVFLEPDLDTLVIGGEEAKRSKPGWPNESRKLPEHWAAYVDKNDFGVGAKVPLADSLTCYRFGDGKPEHGSCSYFAPLTKFAITPGMVFTYDLYLTCGTLTQIRSRLNGADKGDVPRL